MGKNHKDCAVSLGDKGRAYNEQLNREADWIHQEAQRIMERRGIGVDAATDAAIDRLTQSKVTQKRQTIITARKRQQSLIELESAGDERGGWLMAKLVRPLKGGVQRGLSVEQARWKHEAVAHGMFTDGMGRMKSKWFGLTQDRAFNTDVALAVHGKGSIQKTNPDAWAVAQEWHRTAEYLRAQFNEFGGDIKKRSDWGMRIDHDGDLMRKAGKRAWVETIGPLLDEDGVRDAIFAILESDKHAGPISADTFDEALGVVYDKVTMPGASSHTTAIKNRHLDPRVLKFKDADAWLEYNNQFGNSDTFSTMMGHIDQLSREIAAMEVLGPNPRAAFDDLVADVTSRGYGGRKIPFLSEMSSDEGKQAVLESVARQEFGEDLAATGVIAHVFQGTRNTITSAVLGGATLSSMADLGTAALTAGFNRMGVVKTMGAMLRGVFQDPASGAMDVAFARKVGIIVDAASARMRLAHEASGVGITAKLSEFTIRASGLSWWTDMNKVWFGLSMASDMADAFGHKFADADAGFNGMFSRYNWTEADWDALRSVGAWDYKGSKFASLEQVLASDLSATQKDKLAGLLTSTINGELKFAIPEPGSRTLGLMRGRSARGTISGEMRRSAFLFKSFAFEMATGHGSRLMFQASNGDRMKYAAGLMTSTTIMGALAYQLKTMSKGREPMDMDRPDFWVAAMMQGGGLGLLGDFAAGVGGADRFGHSFLVSQAGPVAGLTDDLVGLLSGGMSDAMGGSDMGPTSRTIKTLARYVPGSSLWYLRLAYERALVDNLAVAVDRAGARRSFSAQKRFYKDRFGQDFTVAPGALTK